jgi:hypothetical protein
VTVALNTTSASGHLSSWLSDTFFRQEAQCCYGEIEVSDRSQNNADRTELVEHQPHSAGATWLPLRLIDFTNRAASRLRKRMISGN